jgi:formamidopyrimidine-DNA glycosylase
MTLMPELPEVETVRRGLMPLMEGRRIERVTLNRPDLRFPLPDRLAERLAGRRVERIDRRAKYLLFMLDGDLALIAHLGMSGSFRIETATDGTVPGSFHHPRSKLAAHDHVLFHMADAGDGLMNDIVFNDPRRFGFMDLMEASAIEAYPAFAALGPEPTGNGLDAVALAAAFARRKSPLKTVLLDQTVIAGLGNIYVCEALHRAHLSPLRPAASLATDKAGPTPELEDLVRSIRMVIAEAIEAGGSSLRDHIQTDGSLGYFQHRFRVYDREDQPCPTPGCDGIVARIVQSGRSTFYCPVCQR